MLDKNNIGSFKSSLLRLVSIVSFGLLPFAHVAHAENLKIGDTAPTFKLVNQHGDTVSLDQHSNNWVVLYFYPKNDTPGCTTEACSFRDNINRLIAQQAVVLGVSLDSAESHAKFADKYNLPFDLLSDHSGEVAKQYDALVDFKLFKFAKRHSFIIDPEGKLAKIYRSVDPDKHVKQVMNDLRELQEGYSKAS